jgi:hypothetical protein
MLAVPAAAPTPSMTNPETMSYNTAEQQSSRLAFAHNVSQPTDRLALSREQACSVSNRLTVPGTQHAEQIRVLVESLPIDLTHTGFLEWTAEAVVQNTQNPQQSLLIAITARTPEEALFYLCEWLRTEWEAL